MSNKRTVAAICALLGLVVVQSGVSDAQIRPPTTTKTPIKPLVGPIPTGFRVSGTPLVARLSWDAMPNAARYALWRSDGVSPAMERTPATFAGTTFQDTIPDPRPTWRYSLVAHYVDGALGEAPPLDFISPPLLNPTGFTARHIGGGNVALQWQAVPGAAQYRLDGPGIAGSGRHQTATAVTITATPPGPGVWKVTALYPGNFADYAHGTLARAMVRVLPSRALPWLSRNGIGSQAEADAQMNYECGYVIECWPKPRRMHLHAFGLAFWGDPSRADADAVYGNAADLGVGRRTNCAQGQVQPPYARFVTVCYSTSHGPGPGEAGFGDPTTITWAAAGATIPVPNYSDPNRTMFDAWGRMPRGGTIITMDQTGATFLSFTPGVNEPPTQPLMNWDFAVRPVPVGSSVFDTEGAKFAPHSCIACHGGRYNAATKRVEGATLLPLDPGLLVFSDRQSQEENVRKINQIVLESSPSGAVISYIKGLYNGAVALPGARAVSDYVPAGWAPQSGFYRSVVRPYCTMCHLAAPPHLDFSSWQNFQQNAPAIHTSVCKTRTMPHAEIAFKEFWLKDTGPLFLPGLLAATLGFPSCD